MSFKDIIYCIGIGLLLFEILKSFIFQIRPADKEKILLKYAPKKPFFGSVKILSQIHFIRQ